MSKLDWFKAESIHPPNFSVVVVSDGKMIGQAAFKSGRYFGVVSGEEISPHPNLYWTMDIDLPNAR